MANKENIIQEMIKDIDEFLFEFRKFLKDVGIEAGNKDMMQLIETLPQLKLMLKDVKYVGVAVDENGYIIKVYPIVDFIKYESLPWDIDFGYYLLKDGKYILDEERQRQLEV